MTLGLWLIAARGVHVLAVSLMFGVALFPLYGLKQPTPGSRPLPEMRPLLIGAALVALVSGIFWFALIESQGSIFSGRLQVIWLTRLALAGLVCFLAGKRSEPGAGFIIASAALLLTLAPLGHDGTRTNAAAIVHILADSIHLLASGAWIGALFVLAVLLFPTARRRADPSLVNEALMGFSGIGQVVVVALLLSGLANGGLVGPQNALQSFANPYSQVLALKIALFLLMLVLAAANRYWLTPKLESAIALEISSETAIGILRASIFAETVLAMLVLAAVGWLGVLPPPGT